MSSALRHYVMALSDDDCREIHAQGVEWEKNGKIGDGALRHHAEQWIVVAGINERNVALWMRELIGEVWRRYAAPELERIAPESATPGENISPEKDVPDVDFYNVNRTLA